ncbi:hypothetical protein FKP32DRAFT_1040612 [Trametes sanguinea]|nr:hypothetical protein FKP32DRAFT_1040612 [Trametes sanguinea]
MYGQHGRPCPRTLRAFHLTRSEMIDHDFSHVPLDPSFLPPTLRARRRVLRMCPARRSSVGLCSPHSGVQLCSHDSMPNDRHKGATPQDERGTPQTSLRPYFYQGTPVSHDPKFQNFVEEGSRRRGSQPLVDRRCAGRLPRGATRSTCLLPAQAPRSLRPAGRPASIKNDLHGGQLRCARVVCGGRTYTRAHSRAT